MNLASSLICINCDTIFSLENTDNGDYSDLAKRYKQQCPSCGSTVFMPLANIVVPIVNRAVVQ